MTVRVNGDNASEYTTFADTFLCWCCDVSSPRVCPWCHFAVSTSAKRLPSAERLIYQQCQFLPDCRQELGINKNMDYRTNSQGSIQNAHCYPHFPCVARLCSKDIADWYLFRSDLVVVVIIIVSVLKYMSQLKAVVR
jgi:hypothetical protein